MASPSPQTSASPAAAANQRVDYAAVDAEIAAEIDRLYEAAKTEGEVVMYATFGSEDTTALVNAFQARFPGVEVRNVRGDSSVIVPRFVTEVRAGRVLADIIRITSSDMVALHDEELLAAYDSPARKAIPADYHQAQGFWSGDTILQGVVGYNTSLVSAADAPGSWSDLTDPKWKGQLITDPENGRFFMAYVKQAFPTEEQGIQVWRGIAANAPDPHKGKLLNRDMLASGQGGVCLICYTHHLNQAKDQGAPVAWVRNEAVVEATSIALTNGAPNPNAGKLFITWYLSKEGQQIIGNIGRIPTRPDVDVPGATFIAPDAKRYVVLPEYVDEIEKYEQLYREIFELR